LSQYSNADFDVLLATDCAPFNRLIAGHWSFRRCDANQLQVDSIITRGRNHLTNSQVLQSRLQITSVQVEITTTKRSSHWRRGCVAIFALWSVSAAGGGRALRLQGTWAGRLQRSLALSTSHQLFTLHWAG